MWDGANTIRSLPKKSSTQNDPNLHIYICEWNTENRIRAASSLYRTLAPRVCVCAVWMVRGTDIYGEDQTEKKQKPPGVFLSHSISNARQQRTVVVFANDRRRCSANRRCRRRRPHYRHGDKAHRRRARDSGCPNAVNIYIYMCDNNRVTQLSHTRSTRHKRTNALWSLCVRCERFAVERFDLICG